MRNAKTKTIILSIGSLHLGGAESQIVILAKQLESIGYKVFLFCLDSSGPLIEELSDSNVTVFGGNLFKRKYRFTKALELTKSFFTLLYYCAKIRPTVVHGFLPLTSFLSCFAGWIFGVPVRVVSKRALSTHQQRRPFSCYIDRFSNRFSTHITANSLAVKENVCEIEKANPSKISVIYNALDRNFSAQDIINTRLRYRKELDIKDNVVAFVSVANLIPYKGHMDLIDAFSRCQIPDTKLFLIGEDRGYGEVLKKHVEFLGMDKSIIFLGRRDNVREILNAMDIGVLASHEEGFSNAILEKLAAGLNLVCTDVGGNAEAVSNTPNCYLVPSHDVCRLSEALLKVTKESQFSIKERFARVQQFSQRYSVEKMGNEYVRLYGV